MIKNKNAFLCYSFSFLLLTFYACENEFELEIPEQNKLIILSNFNQDSIINLVLGVPVGDSNGSIIYPNNARIELFENGNYVENLTYVASFPGFVSTYQSSIIPKANSRYKIIATYEDRPEAKAENVIPERAKINFIEPQTSDTVQHPFFQYVVQSKLNIDPLENGPNYFHLKAFLRHQYLEIFLGDTLSYFLNKDIKIEIPPSINHLDISHEEGTLVAQVNLINSLQIPLDFNFGIDPAADDWNIILEFRNVSESYYLFHESVGKQERAGPNSNFLSIPSTLIYNNIENGIGNFSAYNVSIDSLFEK